MLKFVWCFELQSGHQFKVYHTDGGEKFKKAATSLQEERILTTFTTGSTPESNGVAERAYSLVLLMATAELLQAKLPLKYWSNTVKQVP